MHKHHPQHRPHGQHSACYPHPSYPGASRPHKHHRSSLASLPKVLLLLSTPMGSPLSLPSPTSSCLLCKGGETLPGLARRSVGHQQVPDLLPPLPQRRGIGSHYVNSYFSEEERQCFGSRPGSAAENHPQQRQQRRCSCGHPDGLQLCQVYAELQQQTSATGTKPDAGPWAWRLLRLRQSDAQMFLLRSFPLVLSVRKELLLRQL